MFSSASQVQQDGGWWRASFLGKYTEPPPGTGGIMPAPPVPAFLKAAQANAPDETWLVQILEKAEPAAVLRVGERLLRPDWEWSRNGWLLAQPPNAWTVLQQEQQQKNSQQQEGSQQQQQQREGSQQQEQKAQQEQQEAPPDDTPPDEEQKLESSEAVTTRGAGGDGDGEGGATENDLSVDSAAAGATTNGEGEDEEAAVPPVPGLKSPRSGTAAYAARDVDGGGGEAAAEGSGAAAEDGEPSSATAEGGSGGADDAKPAEDDASVMASAASAAGGELAAPPRGRWVFRSDLVKLSPSEIDRKLWKGAAAQGWLVVEACRNGHKHNMWRFCSPKGVAYRSRADALGGLNPLSFGEPSPMPAGGASIAAGYGGERHGMHGAGLGFGGGDGRVVGAPHTIHPRQWARVGMGVEVRLPEPLFRGAWWEAVILEVGQQACHVRVTAFAARDGAEERLDEWVPWNRTRPAPPAPPSDFLVGTRFGEPVEVWWADGWWEATLVAIARPSAQGVGCDAADEAAKVEEEAEEVQEVEEEVAEAEDDVEDAEEEVEVEEMEVATDANDCKADDDEGSACPGEAAKQGGAKEEAEADMKDAVEEGWRVGLRGGYRSVAEALEGSSGSAATAVPSQAAADETGEESAAAVTAGEGEGEGEGDEREGEEAATSTSPSKIVARRSRRTSGGANGSSGSKNHHTDGNGNGGCDRQLALVHSLPRDELMPELPPWGETVAIVTRRSIRMQRHVVAPSLLRPGWRWNGGWSAPCVAAWPPPPKPPPKQLTAGASLAPPPVNIPPAPSKEALAAAAAAAAAAEQAAAAGAAMPSPDGSGCEAA